MSPSTESSISCALAFAFNERKRARSSAVVWRYYWASRAWIAARGRVLLQCIAVTTTCQSAARSSDLTTAMRMLWRVAMGFRGAPHSPPRAVRALRPPRPPPSLRVGARLDDACNNASCFIFNFANAHAMFAKPCELNSDNTSRTLLDNAFNNASA